MESREPRWHDFTPHFNCHSKMNHFVPYHTIFFMSFWGISDFYMIPRRQLYQSNLYPCSVDLVLITAGLNFFNKFSASNNIIWWKFWRRWRKQRYRLISFKDSSCQTPLLEWSFCANLKNFHQGTELCRPGFKPLPCLIQHDLEQWHPVSILYRYMISNSFFRQNNYLGKMEWFW